MCTWKFIIPGITYFPLQSKTLISFGKVIPLRGFVHDIGRSITRKVKIIEMHTNAFSTKDISRSMSHTPTSVDRYIRDFERVKLLFAKGMSYSEIAYITSLSEPLVIEYIKIVKELMRK